MSPKQFRRYHAHARARRREQHAAYRSPTWADGRKALSCTTPDGRFTHILYEGRDDFDTDDRVVLITEAHGSPVWRVAEGLEAVLEWERRAGVAFADELGMDLLLEDD
jgi:hypothetical protein